MMTQVDATLQHTLPLDRCKHKRGKPTKAEKLSEHPNEWGSVAGGQSSWVCQVHQTLDLTKFLENHLKDSL